MIRALLFDKDGTLIDFAATYAEATAKLVTHLGQGDMAIAQNLAKAIDFDLESRIFSKHSVVIAGTDRDVAEAFLPILPDQNLPDLTKNIRRLYLEFTPQSVTPFVATKATLKQLKQAGYPLGVATNDSETSAKNHLKSIGILELFDFVAGYDSGFGAKPGPGMVLAYAKQCQIRPDEIAMIGDSVHDLLCAKNAGAYGIGVASGLATIDELVVKADHCIASIADLPKWLEM